MFMWKKKFEEAITSCQEGLRVVEAMHPATAEGTKVLTDLKEALAGAQYNLGSFYFEEGEFFLALICVREAIAILRGISVTTPNGLIISSCRELETNAKQKVDGIANTKAAYAKKSYDKKEYDKAASLYKELADHYERFGAHQTQATACLNYAKCQVNLAEAKATEKRETYYKDAEPYLSKAKRIHEARMRDPEQKNSAEESLKKLDSLQTKINACRGGAKAQATTPIFPATLITPTAPTSLVTTKEKASTPVDAPPLPSATPMPTAAPAASKDASDREWRFKIKEDSCWRVAYRGERLEITASCSPATVVEFTFQAIAALPYLQKELGWDLCRVKEINETLCKMVIPKPQADEFKSYLARVLPTDPQQIHNFPSRGVVQFELAKQYAHGIGCDRNEDKAIEWYLKAAKQNVEMRESAKQEVSKLLAAKAQRLKTAANSAAPAAVPVTITSKEEAKHKADPLVLFKQARDRASREPAAAIKDYSEAIRILRVPPVNEENKFLLLQCYFCRSALYQDELEDYAGAMKSCEEGIAAINTLQPLARDTKKKLNKLKKLLAEIKGNFDEVRRRPAAQAKATQSANQQSNASPAQSADTLSSQPAASSAQAKSSDQTKSESTSVSTKSREKESTLARSFKNKFSKLEKNVQQKIVVIARRCDQKAVSENLWACVESCLPRSLQSVARPASAEFKREGDRLFENSRRSAAACFVTALVFSPDSRQLEKLFGDVNEFYERSKKAVAAKVADSKSVKQQLPSQIEVSAPISGKEKKGDSAEVVAPKKTQSGITVVLKGNLTAPPAVAAPAKELPDSKYDCLYDDVSSDDEAAKSSSEHQSRDRKGARENNSERLLARAAQISVPAPALTPTPPSVPPSVATSLAAPRHNWFRPSPSAMPTASVPSAAKQTLPKFIYTPSTKTAVSEAVSKAVDYSQVTVRASKETAKAADGKLYPVETLVIPDTVHNITADHIAKISPGAIEILNTLATKRNANDVPIFTVYVVGGAPRDTLMKREAKDVDILVIANDATDSAAHPIPLAPFFVDDSDVEVTEIPGRFLATQITIRSTREKFMVTRGRQFVAGSDNLNVFARTLEQHYLWVDLECNGLFLQWNSDRTDHLTLLAPYVRWPDDTQTQVRCERILRGDLEFDFVQKGNASSRLVIDPGIMLRVLRLSVQLDRPLNSQQIAVIRENAHRLYTINNERLCDEILKLAEIADLIQFVQLLKQCNLLVPVLVKLRNYLSSRELIPIGVNTPHLQSFDDFIGLLREHNITVPELPVAPALISTAPHPQR
jgi:hypothetical protein